MSRPGFVARAAFVAGMASVLSGCGFIEFVFFDDRPTATSVEVTAQIDQYLSGLRDGDLDAAFAVVCRDTTAAPDEAEWYRHHRAESTRPVEWTVEHHEPAVSGGSGQPGRNPKSDHTEVTIVFDDGLEATLRHGWRGGVCVWSSNDGPDADEARRRVIVDPSLLERP